MTPAPQPHQRPIGLAPALLGLVMVLGLMGWLKDDLNPDWISYSYIYNESGAWLADQGRDPLFLWLVTALRATFGPDGYDAFRAAVAFYFAAFTWVLLRGQVLPFDPKARHAWPLLLLGLLPFVAPRFTIQIREGLALTAVLMGMAVLSHSAGSTTRNTRQLLALGLFFVGTLFHSGTGILLLALIVGLVVQRLSARLLPLELWILLALGLAAAAISAGVSVFGLGTSAGNRFVENLYGVEADVEATLTFWKWVYWGCYGLGVAVMAGRVHGLYRSQRLPEDLRPVLGVITMVMLPAIYIAALLMLAGGLPPIVVSGAARLMNMLLSVTLLVLALRGALTLRLGLFAVLVVVDQARIIVEAVLSIVPVEL